MAYIQAKRDQLAKNLQAPDFKGLASEYPSFDLLWFDIETKTRHLVEELLDPVIDRLVNHKDLINQIKQEGKKSSSKVEELREMFLNTNGKMDVFEQINVRISQAEAEVKILEDKFEYENKHIK